MVVGFILQREEHLSAEEVHLYPVECAAEEGAELVQRRPEIACLVKFVVKP